MTLPTNPPHVCGVDLSLTSTGLAWPDGRTQTLGRDGITAIRDVGARTEAMERLSIELTATIMSDSPWPVLVVIEDLTQRGGAAGISTEKAHVWWSVVRNLHANGRPVLPVPVKTAKLYAFGKGDANKREMMTSIQETFPGWEIRKTGKRGTVLTTLDDNKADAVALMAVGCHLLGYPLVEVTPWRLRALEKLILPGGVRR